MIKKISALVCVCVLAFALVGCGSSKPKDMDDAVYENGKQAYELCQDYQAGKLSAEELDDKLEAIYNRNERTVDGLGEQSPEETVANFQVGLCILGLRIHLSPSSTASSQDIDNDINELAKAIGEK